MTLERSCGAVVFTRVNGEIRYVLGHAVEGFYGFPKGHMEPGETPEETALREIREEVGLEVALLPGFHTQDEYPLPKKPGTRKRVDFFLAEYADQPLVPQETEFRSAGLYSYDEALQLLQREGSRRVLREANEHLMNRE